MAQHEQAWSAQPAAPAPAEAVAPVDDEASMDALKALLRQLADAQQAQQAQQTGSSAA